MPRCIRSAPEGQHPASLKDPCGDRPLPVSELPLPPSEALTLEICYGAKGKPDLELLRKHLQVEGAISQELLFDLIEKAADLFDREPNLLKLEDPITVVGDIHGQYWDLMKLFDVGGPPGETQYLFLGDYVDRGSFSIEVLCYLFACKVRYPKKIHMLRGNHECRQMTAFFNFREECEYKYDLSIYNAFMEAFDTLPLCATINNKYFGVHGGISPDLTRLNEIGNVDRMQEPPREGIMCDLIWADQNDKDDSDAAARGIKPFTHNDVRGCSFFFSADSAAKFLKKNNLLSIIRAHEAQIEGYKMHKTNPATGFPSVITVFSAPNYCDTYNNKAAILKLDNSTLNVLQFNCSPHPYYLPNFMDIFSWSLPFMVEKVLEFANEIMMYQEESGKELPELPQDVAAEFHDTLSAEESPSGSSALALATKLNEHIGKAAAAKRGELPPDSAPPSSSAPKGESSLTKKDVERMKKKIKAVGKMCRMLKTLRQENQQIVKLKGVCPGHRLRPGVLLEGKERIQNELEMFGYVRSLDSQNEKRPPEDEEANPIVMTKTLSLHRRKKQVEVDGVKMSPKEQLEAAHRAAAEQKSAEAAKEQSG